MARDSQRSRCYKWEDAAQQALAARSMYEPEFKTLEECEAFALPVWRAERGRLGLAGVKAPSIERPNWGQRRALAHHDHRITLPRWARSRWVILHELAHRLTPKDEAHGPRFVGALIGLACRWLDFDAVELMRMAEEHGVKFHIRTIGSVPSHGPAWHVERALRHERPMTAMDLASWLSLGTGADLTVSQVRGAALVLIRQGRARWLRGKLVPLGDLLPKVEPQAKPIVKRKTPLQVLRDRAEPHGIEVEVDGAASYWVTHPKLLDSDPEHDPLEGDHWCASIGEARDKVEVYIAALAEGQKA